MIRIQKLVRMWRVMRNQDQKELADELDINASSLCRFESGKGLNMRDTGQLIAWLFGEDK